jgi:hypothetical protein
MKIPYGVSNFGELRTNGYFYVDKTHFLPELENLGPRYLLFLRPRRIGKSLFVSLLEHYYDLGHADQFDALFGGLWIHRNPTPERHRYLVLSLDFSQVPAEGGVDALCRGFTEAMRSALYRFLLLHRERVPELGRLLDRIEDFQRADVMLARVMAIVGASGHKMFVLIDDYDHFVEHLLADDAQRLCESIAKRIDCIRSFYFTLKAGTACGDVSRIFITGISPLKLDYLLGGFDIAAHVSEYRSLNTLAGFTHAEVEHAVDTLLASQPELASLPGFPSRSQLLAILEEYYGGYRFSPDSPARVFNPDMVLYFLRDLGQRARYPTDMLDPNVCAAYRSLQRIGMRTGAARDERRALLESILSEGGIQTSLVRQFGVATLSSQASFLSVLYYVGMLTLGQSPPDMSIGAVGYRLEIPNRVIRELQRERLALLLEDESNLTIDAEAHTRKCAPQKTAAGAASRKRAPERTR